MKYLLFIFGISIASPCFTLAQNMNWATMLDKKCGNDDILKCVNIGFDWFGTLPKRSIPTTDTEIERMCTEIEHIHKCVDDFANRCLLPAQRLFADGIILKAKELTSEFCSKGTEMRGIYDKHSKCLNKAAKQDGVLHEIEYYLAAMERTDSVAANKQINYGCCLYSRGRKSAFNLIRKQCGSEAERDLKALVDEIVVQTPVAYCKLFTRKANLCNGLLPPEGSTPSEAFKDSEIYKILNKPLMKWLY